MQAQGTGAINTAYFDEAIASLNAINVCADLQAAATAINASLQAEITAIHAQIAALTPLLTIPHDLGSVISWITNAIAPHQAAANSYVAQLTALASKVSALASAMSAAASRITNRSISVPSVTL